GWHGRGSATCGSGCCAGARAPPPPRRRSGPSPSGPKRPIRSNRPKWSTRSGRPAAPARPKSNRRSNVSGMKKPGENNLMFFSGRAYPELAEEVARHLGIEITPTKLTDFANGEIYARYLESVRGCDAFVIQCHTAPINKWIMEQLIMVDALKRASAKRITVIMPFFGYARQDKKGRGREPITARLIADLFKTAGADRLMAVDLHTPQ